MEIEKDDIIDNRYSIIKKIDSGGYGIVYMVTDNQENGQKYAAKIYKFLKGVEREIEIFNILKKLHNPFLINLIREGKGTIIHNESVYENKKYLILELAPRYNLFQYIDSTGEFKEIHCKIISKKILEAINAMHKNGVYHLDIKLENILLDEKFEPKITDFGLSKKKEETTDGFLEGRMGTKNYMPPQMFIGNKKFNPIKADIFSLGVTIFTLSAGKCGFGMAKSSDYFYQHIAKNTPDSIKYYWKEVKNNKVTISKLLKKLYIRMVAFDENERPSIDDILKDEWFKEIDELSKEERDKLEKDIYSEFEKREKIVKESNKLKITEDTIDDNISNEGKTGDIKEYFEKQETKFEKKGMIMENYIRIDRDLNPVNYMNKLINKIQFYEFDCEIDASKKNLKFNVIINGKDLEDESIDDEDELTLNNNKIYKKLIIQIKLFKAIDGKYLLRFSKKEGDISNFYYKLKKYMSYAQKPEVLSIK